MGSNIVFQSTQQYWSLKLHSFFFWLIGSSEASYNEKNPADTIYFNIHSKLLKSLLAYFRSVLVFQPAVLFLITMFPTEAGSSFQWKVKITDCLVPTWAPNYKVTFLVVNRVEHLAPKKQVLRIENKMSADMDGLTTSKLILCILFYLPC